ncbi:ABC-type glycerol-3-phosphate transport system substrate-binding protein [Curtobacterium sp. PhB130]|nr:ABC-type glycerol-3-phosphate transport system substrate-binding protein [Curtobacterium sp. PhB130]TCK63779.1 ABC-type glycerol-3-phosphate transport system substrate-binding protein [Curtobacterium sp. PhB136]
MKSRTRIAFAAIATTAAIGMLAGCSTGSNAASSDGKTKIVVAIDAGLEKPAKVAFQNQVKAFEKANPKITVTSREYTWTGTTFAAELAGGTLPDVFTIPFTDGKSLIQQNQIADISGLVSKLPYAEKFNPNVVKNGENADGDIEALPIAAYGQALHYNRDLFTQAGLDPDSPPTTWAEVRADAKQIADKTGKAGYATMTQGNTGGWILTSLAYAMGGRAETGSGAKTKATVDTAAYEKALTLMQDMRWKDDSMGGNFLYDWNAINQAFASGQVGMYVSGGGNYGSLVSQNQIDPKSYGETVVPLSGKDAGALGGGTLAAVSAKSTAEQQAAAVKWIDFYYMQKLFTKADAQRDAKTLAASDQPVGAPQVPVFDKATYDKTLEWTKEWINVPLDQMKPYTEQQFDQTIVPEPAKNTQELYGLLDPVVQAVLTDKSADPAKLLSDAQTQIQAKLDSAK